MKRPTLLFVAGILGGAYLAAAIAGFVLESPLLIAGAVASGFACVVALKGAFG